ncbi:MAG: pyridoxamine 5'-phosphate oxidase family protein [Lentilitoribacter sp.]
MLIDLATIDETVWANLIAATKSREHDLRYLSLATLSQDQVPVSRLLVLRDLNPDERKIIFHTDILSDKWSELSNHPKASILGFSTNISEQIRFEGRVELFNENTEINQSEWDKLSIWSKNTYCGGPSGDDANPPQLDEQKEVEPPSDEQLEQGRSRFGVIQFKVDKLDWFRLQRSDNRRAKFCYNSSGGIENASWINP